MTRSYATKCLRKRDIFWLAVVLVLLLKDVIRVSFSHSTPVADLEEQINVPRGGNNVQNLPGSNLTVVGEAPMDILLAISGNHSGVFEEMEVLIKSVLLNAPLNRPLTIHVVADEAAFDMLPMFFWSDVPQNEWQVKSNLSQLFSFQQVTVKTYNVQEHIVRWERRIKQLYRRGDLNANFARRELEYHTIGTWFRLMADEILPSDVSHVLYLDVDIVVLANLGELWDFYLDREKWFQWGRVQPDLSVCSVGSVTTAGVQFAG